jgi:hypothetical protein
MKDNQEAMVYSVFVPILIIMGVFLFARGDGHNTQEPTVIEDTAGVENMTTESAEMVSAIDPTGKDLTAITAQIKETEVLLANLKAQQDQLKKGITLRVGQVWQDCSAKDNPFEDSKCAEYEITAIKDGYVAYTLKFTDSGNNRT